jgi:hypothetical protein
MKKKPAAKSKTQKVIAVLETAELQIENDAQKAELHRALVDLIQQAGPAAQKAYADYGGNQKTWSAAELVTKYFYFRNASIPTEHLLAALGSGAVRPLLKKLLERLAGTCIHHAGRPKAGERFGKALCAKCITGADGAAKRVDKHVEPKPCFITYKGNDVWDPIEGTGCAHWVAHQLNKSNPWKCMDEKTLRVPDLIANTQSISRDKVAVNDIWANSDRDHCGMVIAVSAAGNSNKITIRHCSSGQGGVVNNDFDQFFKAQGTFHR